MLGLASHYASVWAISMGVSHWERVAIVNGAYFATNCVTFVSRFLIFHYVLFANRSPAGRPGLTAARPARPARPARADQGEPISFALPRARR